MVYVKDYDSQYADYKHSLLHSHRFVDNLKEDYKKTIHSESDYIDRNGVFLKVGILAFLCGFSIAVFFLIEGNSSIWSIVIRIISFTIAVVCAIAALRIESKYKKSSGERDFYSYQYSRYIKDCVQYDKEEETEKIFKDIIDNINFLRISSEVILSEEDNTDIERLKSNMLYAASSEKDFKNRYEKLSRYDRFERDILEDYYFQKSIFELLE